MADDPLDSWQKTLAADRLHAAMLPKGPVKNALNKKLREMEIILQVVTALPETDPFRRRVNNVARLMNETPVDDAAAWKRVLDEFAACLKVARSRKTWLTALGAKPAPKGE